MYTLIIAAPLAFMEYAVPKHYEILLVYGLEEFLAYPVTCVCSNTHHFLSSAVSLQSWKALCKERWISYCTTFQQDPGFNIV